MKTFKPTNQESKISLKSILALSLTAMPFLASADQVTDTKISDEEQEAFAELISYCAMVIGTIVVIALAWFTASSKKRSENYQRPIVAKHHHHHHVKHLHKRRSA